MNFSLLEPFNTLRHSLASGFPHWGNFHILVVHFPIALLCTPPIFIVLGLGFPKTARLFFTSALILMLFGTGSLFLAVSTGNAASDVLSPNPPSVATLNAHIRLGEQAKTIYGALFLLWGGYVWKHPAFARKIALRWHYIFITSFLIFYAYGLLVLFNTAHHGGALVHQHHIHSQLYQQSL